MKINDQHIAYVEMMSRATMLMPTTIIVQHTHITNDINHLNGTSSPNHPQFEVKVPLSQIIMNEGHSRSMHACEQISKPLKIDGIYQCLCWM